MHVVIRFVDAQGQPIDNPTPEQLARLANAYAAVVLAARFPGATFQHRPVSPAVTAESR